jgi:hypothetical protein
MMRKSLFWGLTLLLLAALINLIVRGRQLESEQGDKVVEVIQDSQTTPTRVLTPGDLEIVEPVVKLARGSGPERLPVARHEIEIRNSGTVPYRETKLRIAYLDRFGKVLTTRVQLIEKTIAPMTNVKFSDIPFQNIPPSAVACRISIVYADIGQATVKNQ